MRCGCMYINDLYKQRKKCMDFLDSDGIRSKKRATTTTPETYIVTLIFNFLSSVLNICMYTFESYIEKI